MKQGAGPKRKKFQHVCAVCGRRFSSRQWNSRYCREACRKKGVRRLSSLASKRWNAKRKRDADAARHDRGDLSLADVVDADFRRRVNKAHQAVFGKPKRPGELWRQQNTASYRQRLAHPKNKDLLEDLDKKKLQDAINAAR